MSFRTASSIHDSKSTVSNSVTGEKFLERYDEFLKKRIIDESEGYMPSRTFAPSSIRCRRRNWFRIRGTVPDSIKSPSMSLNHINHMGTFLHESIQSDMVEMLGDKWISIEEYLEYNPIPYKYSISSSDSGYETKITIEDPPVKFACDGIIELDGKKYLLEIKTCEARILSNLVDAKPEHIDQVRCYCTLLGLDDAIILYKDRQYGKMKAFTYHMEDSDRCIINSIFDDVTKALDRNLPPSGLPVGDKWCNPDYCVYYKSCQQWGRY